MSISDKIKDYVSYNVDLNWHSDLTYEGISYFPTSYVLDMAALEIFLVDSLGNVKQLVLDSKGTIDPNNFGSTYPLKVTSLDDAKTYDSLCKIFRFASYANGFATTLNELTPLSYTTSNTIAALNLETGVPYSEAGINSSIVNNPQYWTKYNTDSFLFQFAPLKVLKPVSYGSTSDPFQWPIYKSSNGYMNCGVDQYVEQACKPLASRCYTCQRNWGAIGGSMCNSSCGTPPAYCWNYTSFIYGMFYLQKQPNQVNSTDVWDITSLVVNFDENKIDQYFINDDNGAATLNQLSSTYKIVLNLVSPNTNSMDYMNAYMNLIKNNQLFLCCDQEAPDLIDDVTSNMCKSMGFDSTNKLFNNKCVAVMNDFCASAGGYTSGACIDYCNNGNDINGNPINCDSIMTRNCSNIPKGASYISNACSCFMPGWVLDDYWNKLLSYPGSSLMKKVECEYIPCTSGANDEVVQRNSMRTGRQNCSNVNLCINTKNIKYDKGSFFSADSLDLSQYADCVNASITSTPTSSPSTSSPTPSSTPISSPSPTDSIDTPSSSDSTSSSRFNLSTFIISLKPKSWTMSDTAFIRFIVIFLVILLIFTGLFFMSILLV